MAAARGHIAVRPEERLLILYLLCRDSDEEISRLSEETIRSIPVGTILSVLSDEMTHPELLEYFARTATDVKQIKAIIFNHSTPDSALEHIARTTHNQSVLELMVSNKERVLQSEDIIEALCSNPGLKRSTMEKLLSSLGLYLIDDDEASDFFQELAEDPSNYGQGYTPAARDRLIDFSSNLISDSQELSLDKVELGDETPPKAGQVDGKKKRATHAVISRMNFPGKIKLAMYGNHDARSLLIHHPNRVIACSVLKNPGLTESEVLLFAQSKVVDEEVLRIIGETRKWVRHYPIKHSLVSNPKTPVHISLNFMSYMRDNDLKNIRNDKNVPEVVAIAAARVLKGRVKGSKRK